MVPMAACSDLSHPCTAMWREVMGWRRIGTATEAPALPRMPLSRLQGDQTSRFRTEGSMFRKARRGRDLDSRQDFRMARRVPLLLATLAAAHVALGISPAERPSWLMISQDPAGGHNQPLERQIGPLQAGRLAPKWVATTTGDVSATPVVADGAVYFPDWGGSLWKLNAATGQVIWSHLISDYD